jgi:hypothetical protein
MAKTFTVKVSGVYSANVTVTEQKSCPHTRDQLMRRDGLPGLHCTQCGKPWPENTPLVWNAVCGQTTITRTMDLQTGLQESEEQFLAKIEGMKDALAKEAAGVEHIRLLREKFFSDGASAPEST